MAGTSVMNLAIAAPKLYKSVAAEAETTAKG